MKVCVRAGTLAGTVAHFGKSENAYPTGLPNAGPPASRIAFDSPHPAQRGVDLLKVEGCGIKRSTDPVPHALMLRMTRIGHRMEEIGVSPDPTAVFGWARTPPHKTDRVQNTGLGLLHSFDKDRVPPAITKIVLVHELERCSWNQLAQLQASLIPDFEALFRYVVRIWHTIVDITHDELMEMRICPPHHHLQHPCSLYRVTSPGTWNRLQIDGVLPCSVTLIR